MEKKKRLINSTVMFVFTFVIIFSVISLRFQRATVRLEDIDVNETVLALHYENWAWGYQNYLLIADKEGRCKFLELKDGEMQDYNLNINKNLLEAVISTEDFDLKYIGEACDAGSCCYYSVYGCGENRKLVYMQKDGDVKCRSRFFEVTGICEKMYERYTSVYKNGIQL